MLKALGSKVDIENSEQSKCCLTRKTQKFDTQNAKKQ